ncbi:hypothetical protein AAK706_11670 [Erysipelotrichaceae bacterium 66-17]
MAEHRVRKNNIIYIIPDDELFRKWKDDEAFIDEYGRLMNRKPHRVLRELKHYVEDAPTVQQRTSARFKQQQSVYSLLQLNWSPLTNL